MIKQSFPVRLYVADASELMDELLYARAYAVVSEERKQKTDRFRFSKDRCLSLGAELLLRHGLAEAGVVPDTMKFGYGKYEKPFLTSFPSIHFNISHSGKRVICAISSCSVGCDIEKITEPDAAVAGRFFTQRECNAIFTQKTPDARKRMFFRMWTLKESYLKATGVGVSQGLNTFEILINDNSIRLIQNRDAGPWFFQEYLFDKEYACSVCSSGNCFEEEVHDVQLKDVLDRLL